MALKGGTDGSGGPDLAVVRLAEEQHGVVSRAQLLERGLTDARIRGRLSRRSLLPVHRGVYAVGHRRLSREARWMAAVLACGPGAVLSHRSAAQLWRMIRPLKGLAEVTRAIGWRAPRGIVVRRSPLSDGELTELAGIPVTTVPRTLLDLAAMTSRWRLERALNEAEVLGLTDALSLPDLLERYPRRAGTAALRVVLADETALNGPTRNDFEELFAALVDAHALPKPRFNADVVVRDRHINADCLWRESQLIVELDGGAVHRTRRAFEADRKRDRILHAEGWEVVRVTWRQLRDEPQAVVEDVRRLLRRRSAAAPTL